MLSSRTHCPVDSTQEIRVRHADESAPSCVHLHVIVVSFVRLCMHKRARAAHARTPTHHAARQKPILHPVPRMHLVVDLAASSSLFALICRRKHRAHAHAHAATIAAAALATTRRRRE